MNNSIDSIQVEFHNKATESLFAFFQAFENEADIINRKTNEFHFQELKKKYTASLEQDLQMVAKSILESHKFEDQLEGIDPMLRQFIRDYLHRFIQKINAL